MKKKKKILLVVIIFFMLIGLFTGIIYFINSKKTIVSLKKNRNVEINSEVYNLDFIDNINNGKIISEKKIIDTSHLGKKKIVIKIKNSFGKIKLYNYYVNVVDEESPAISFNGNLSTTVGTSIDLLKDVSVSDNSNEDIKVTVEGEYDFNKEGSYELYYVAQDSSGNEKKEKFTLTVNKKVAYNADNIKYFTTSKGFSGYTKNGITYIDGILIANKTYSLPASYNPGGLTRVTREYMNKMFADAKSIGLNIYLSSGFRSYSDQKYIYNNYVSYDGKEKADTYSARAGHSEHQTGFAFDVNDISSAFNNTDEARWLSENAWKYGFILRYPKGKTNETGYMYESWHFRYVGEELAKKLYNNGDWITLESYFGITSKYNY